MYAQLRGQPRTNTGASVESQRAGVRGIWVSRTVVYLGLTSLFTDISAEMVSSVLPLYFLLTLGFSPLQFGILDGLYQGASALVQVASALVSDRLRRQKGVAAVGYALSAFAKPALLMVGGAWAALTAVIVIDRTGKGIRTAPRDALISLSSPSNRLGTAFGVHRALDTCGAMLGPVIAFGLLTLAPNSFDTIFIISFCVALIGLAIIVLFVRDQPAKARAVQAAQPAVSLRGATGLLALPRVSTLLVVGAVLGAGTISDSFLYLVLQDRLNMRVGLFPLLYVATSLVYFLLAVPGGWLADRAGRARVFIAGYALLLGVYAAVLAPSAGMWSVAGAVLLLGVFYALTDGVLVALASGSIPEELRATGLALLATVIGISKLVGSVLFGAIWTWQGPTVAVVCFLVSLLVIIPFGAWALMRTERSSYAN